MSRTTLLTESSWDAAKATTDRLSKTTGQQGELKPKRSPVHETTARGALKWRRLGRRERGGAHSVTGERE